MDRTEESVIRLKTAILVCMFTSVIAATVQAFDYDSYQPGDLDEVLAKPRPKSGVDVISMQKLALKATLESYPDKETCPVADILKLAMKMLPSLYPKAFADSISASKCIKIKSPKGVTLAVVIQDKVADFLQKEVPLGTEVKLYCVLVCITAEGPGMIVTEFKAPNAAKAKEQKKAGE
jgi:hypothetical protein